MVTYRELSNTVAEYESVLRQAGAGRWLPYLIAAHTTPCTQSEAERILQGVALPDDLKLRFKSRAGRARWIRKKQQYSISLPEVTHGIYCLRVGVVLHEAAHIACHQRWKKFGHGEQFCTELRRLLIASKWRNVMSTRSYREIYDRHRGPFSLLLTREEMKKGREEQVTEKVKGPFSAEEAHEEAVMLVNDTRDNVLQVHVFSDGEGQFCGAFYKRGETYKTWEEETEDAGRMESHSDQPAPALLQGRSEPVSEMAASKLDGVSEESISDADGDRPVRDVPEEEPAAPRPKRAAKPAKLPGDRFPVVRGKALTLGKTEGWPPSKPAQVVLAYMSVEGRKGTSAELIAALGAELTALGVAHPGSLVSRLKQAGLLVEVA
jgi:hypothetical protein